jgi:hypothetical protein
MSRSDRLARFGTLAVLFGCGVGLLADGKEAAAQAPNSDALLEDVRTAWREREAAIRSLRVTWTNTTLTPKGVLTELSRARSKGQDLGPVPPADATHKESGSLAVSADNIKLEMSGWQWNDGKAEFVPYRAEALFDGKVYTWLTEVQGARPNAVQLPATKGLQAAEARVSPVVTAARGTSEAFMPPDLRLDAFTQARRVTVNNRALVELLRPRNESAGEAKMWVDPAQKFALAKLESYNRKGEVLTSVIVTQSRVPDAAVGWLPERWTYRFYSPAGKLFRETVAVTGDRQVNPALEPSTFQPSLKPGTNLVEGEGKDETFAIIKDDGTKRIVLREELHATYDELNRTETGDLAPGRLGREWRWIGLSIAAILFGLGCVFWRSQSRRRRYGTLNL